MVMRLTEYNYCSRSYTISTEDIITWAQQNQWSFDPYHWLGFFGGKKIEYDLNALGTL